MKRVEPGARHQTPGAGDGTGTSATAGQVPSAQAQAPIAQSPVPGFSLRTMTTKPSFRADFKAGEGGKTPVYLARWVNTRGEKGPWSEVTSATVAA